jgi:thermostable 8-oxoguanine DNA glycosylase
LSGASFLSQFASAGEFYGWVNLFNSDEKTRAALPMLLAEEIDGFGFALGCDFLMWLGYFDFAKPDVHLRDLFEALRLCPSGASDYHVFKAILRVAKNSKKSPFAVDQLFWLIGSGNFFNHPDIGNEGRIGSRKKEFIRSCRKNGLR